MSQKAVHICRKTQHSIVAMAADDTTPRPGDTKNELLRKIVQVANASGAFSGVATPPRPGDLNTDLLRKLLTRLGT